MDSNSDTPPPSPHPESVREDDIHQNEQVNQDYLQSEESEQTMQPGQPREPDRVEEPQQAEEPEHIEELEHAVEPEQAEAPEHIEELEHAVEPVQAEELEQAVEPEQAEEPEHIEELEHAVELEQTEAPEQMEELEHAVELEQAKELEHAVEPEQAEAPEQMEELEHAVEPVQAEELEHAVEPEQAEAPEQMEELEHAVEPEQAKELEHAVEPEQAEAPEQMEELEHAVEPVQAEAPEQMEEPQQAYEPEQAEAPEQMEELEHAVELEQAKELEHAVEPEQAEAPEQMEELEHAVEPVQAEELEHAVEPEQAEAPEQMEELEHAVEPEQAKELEHAVEPEQAEAPEQMEELEHAVEPEQAKELEHAVEPEQAEAPEQMEELEHAVEPVQAEELEHAVEPEQAEAPEQMEELEHAVEPEQAKELEHAVEPEQAEAPEHIEELEHAVEPVQAEELEQAVEPEQAEEPEHIEELEHAVGPEQAEAPEQMEEPQQAYEPEQAEAPEQMEELEHAVEPEQAEEPEHIEELEHAVEPEQAKELEHAVEPEQAKESERREHDVVESKVAEVPEHVEEREYREDVAREVKEVGLRKPYVVDDVVDVVPGDDSTVVVQELHDRAPISVGAEVARSREEAKEELPDGAGSIEETADPMQPRHPSCAVQTTDTDVTTPPLPPIFPREPEVPVPDPSLLPGGYIVSSEIEVLADATVYPMGFRVVVRVPGMPSNEVSTRLLFECIAARLGSHPEALRISCRGERIRFGKTVMFEREDAKATPHQDMLVAGRLWVDVHFDDGRLPPHLETLAKEDILVRCVQVRARLPPICATDLVAARCRGLDYLAAEQEWRMKTHSEDIVTVAILQEPHGTRLPYLGGYRSKKDPTRIFLHAATQLFSPSDTTLADLQHGPLRIDGFSRQTQTWGVTRSCQTRREAKTQTGRPDYVPDETWDEVVIAKPYFTSGQLLALHKERAVVIQKMYRKWKARKIRCELATERQAYLDHAAAQAAAEEAARQHYEEFERRRRELPRTSDDFVTLRRELEAWRAAETARTMNDTSLNEAEKRAAFEAITKRELQLLQEIETLRRAAVVNRRARRFETILEEMASTKECGAVTITTQAAERARELRQLYLALTQPISSVEARLDTLLHIKWTVKEFDAPLTREMVELIDREADLMHRGRTAASLKGLRMRQENLFKRFIATPEYNPAVQEVVKGPKFGSVPEEWTAIKAASRRLKPANVI